MIYGVLRILAGIALRWYYERVEVAGVDRVPAGGPLLVAANHPNALVDALVTGWMVPRRLLITAKATLFANPVAAVVLRGLGVVPLRRASDEGGVHLDAARNTETFRAVVEQLARGGAVLIFPEGKSHDEPWLAPLRTGAARMALAARDANVRGLRIVPIGITFERKESPRTRVYAQVGDPIDVDAWMDATRGDARALTAELEQRIRALTLNFDSPTDAARATALASLFARVAVGERPVGARAASLGAEVAILRRVEAAERALSAADDATRARASALLDRLAAFDRRLADMRLRLEDVEIDREVGPGARFTAREGAVAALVGPVALWGRLNHWIPFNAARALARIGVQSAADPAMRTIVAGLALVLLFYGLQTALVWRLVGGGPAAVYVATLPLAADANFLLATRLRRAWRRARAYLTFRRDPALHDALVAELHWLRAEATAVERALDDAPVA